MTHTPGPWHVSKTGNHQGLVVSEATGANVAVTYDAKDAPAVAAVPDLLQAAQEAEVFIDNIKVYGRDDVGGGLMQRQIMRNKLRAVIAKAKGEA